MKRKTTYFTLFLLLVLVSLLWVSVATAQDAEGQEYVVQADDWLSKIAEKEYGDVLAYPIIVEATNAKAAEDDSFAVIDNPDLIEIGQKLWLPAAGTMSAMETTGAMEATTEETMAAEATAEEATAEETMAESEAAEPEFAEFDPANFSNATNIDNQWLPMQPGTQWVFEGITVEDGEEIPHRIEFTVTDLVKPVAGVDTVVAWIVDISDEEVVEKEIAFYAQNDDGSVWYLGEHPEEYEEGEFIDAPTWLAGVEDARAGIKMKADPQPGPPYFQGWAPAVEWSDYGQVAAVGQETCVPAGCYENVLAIDESSLDEAGAFQVKYYAPGVGNVQVGWKGEDATQEELELIEFTQLDPEALATIREEALALDQHAYEVSPEVYGQTAPAAPPTEED